MKPWSEVSDSEKDWLAGVFSIKGSLQSGSVSMKHTANPAILHKVASLLGGTVTEQEYLPERVVYYQGSDQPRVWKKVDVAIWKVEGAAVEAALRKLASLRSLDPCVSNKVMGLL